MDKLKAMRVFVRIVDTGSLTAAAAAGGQSPASVVRTLAALEQALGVRLLNRSTRRLALTDEGRDYLARCRHILAALDEAEAVLSAGQVQPAGSLGVTAPVTFGRRHVAPLLSEFLAGHDGLRGELVLLDRVVNLVEEGLDLAVRIGRLADSSLVAVPLGHTRHVVCASPALLARLGRPARPEALEGCPGIWFGPQGGRWPFLADGEVLDRRVVRPGNAVNAQIPIPHAGPNIVEIEAADLGYARYLREGRKGRGAGAGMPVPA